jgi:hypothetical protein
MRLEDYWGVGPKTSERLRDQLGEEAAVEAIESADVRALTDAGITRGRATRILRRANDEAGMDALATRDTREVYDDLLALASEYALTRHAADRIRVLTPLSDPDAVVDRLDAVDAARGAWTGLDDAGRAAVVDAFDAYDAAAGTERAAVDAVLALRDAGLDGSTFDALGDIDPDAVREAADALQYVTPDGVAAGADDRLDDLRGRLDDARDLENSAFDVLERIRETGVRDLTDFRSAFADYVDRETRLSRSAIEEVAPAEAHDAADFVSTALRALVDDYERRVADREREVEDDLRASIADARDDVDRAVAAVDDVALDLSLARFAAAHDLVRPILGGDGLAVEGARNLCLDDPDPVDYAVGDHDLSPPTGDCVAVLTGANSGGKTTLLETCCAVALLAAMGLPVPADRAEVGEFDAVVFHRRHASFNAGVLESTLKSIVPPLTVGGRTLMLVDEFEAITEPGRAADLLNGLVDLTVERGALGVYVTHLADDLSPLPDAARIDGIFAEGLTPGLDLRVDYQPRFGTVGKSTPEFIVSRLVANAGDRRERQGFEHLAAAVGEEAVQRTLSDAWEA